MNANTHILDAVKVAEELDDLAAKRGNAEALRLLGTLWHRLDSTAPIALHLPNWAKGFTPLELRALLMDEYDRRGELFSLPRRPEVFIVYRIGCNREQAANGIGWHRLKRHAKAAAARVGATFLATAYMNRADYIALKCDRTKPLQLLTLTPPLVLEIEEIGGRRRG